MDLYHYARHCYDEICVHTHRSAKDLDDIIKNLGHKRNAIFEVYK